MAKYIVYDFLKQDFPVSQEYGVNEAYYAQFNLDGHEGVDFKTPNGTEIFSPLNGVIVRDGYSQKDYGNYVVVYDPVQHCAVWFCHLLDNAVAIGDRVAAGQYLGRTNNTGNTTGPHCHVNFCETDANGIRINMDNGKQGFLNLFDSELVEIKPFPWTAAQKEANAPFELVEGQQYIETQLPPDLFNVTNYQIVVYRGKSYVATVSNNGTRSFFMKKPQEQAKTISTPTAPLDTGEYVNKEQFDAMQKQRDDAIGKVKEIGDNYNENLANYTALTSAGFSSVDDVTKALEEVINENTGLKKQLIQTKDNNVILADTIKKMESQDSTAIDAGIKFESLYKEAKNDIVTIATAHQTKPTANAILRAIDGLRYGYDKLVLQLQKKETKDSVSAATQPDITHVNGKESPLAKLVRVLRFAL